jgi:hypothetical protein
MNFLIDANMPRSAVAATSAAGHSSVYVRDTGLRDAPDADIAAYARQHRLCIVTRDFDFADIRNYPPADYEGLVVLDVPDDAVATQVSALLGSFLAAVDVETVMPGRLAIVRPQLVRFRPKLDP